MRELSDLSDTETATDTETEDETENISENVNEVSIFKGVLL